MKKILSALVCVSACSIMTASAFQAGVLVGPKTEPRAPLAAQFSLGVLNGDAVEHVFDYEGPGGARRNLSRLDWELKNIVMGGAQISARVTERLTLNGGLWLALSEGSGEMDDYDWLDPDSTDWTHYSLSDVDVTEGYVIDVNAGWDLLQSDNAALRVVAGYKQNGWSWEDRGVFLLYPDNGYIPYPLEGENMINYEQEFRIPYLGLGADYQAGALTFSAYLNWSPLVYANDWDHHIARNIRFKETFENGDMLGAGVDVRYQIERGFFSGVFVGASIHYQQLDLIVGDMEAVDMSTGEYYFGKDEAGIENEYTAFLLNFGFPF